jgi:tubulin monoglycylase TTLL15
VVHFISLSHERLSTFQSAVRETIEATSTREPLRWEFSILFPDMLEEFKEFVAKNPQKKFVEKNKNNRGVKIIDEGNVDFNKSDKLYQVFMDNPFLIEGHAFDLGVFVLISSIDPLRIYRYNTEVLMRFCPEPYYPFDAGNIEKYVVHETHKHFTQMNWFENHSETFGGSCKSGFEDYIEDQGFDAEDFWKKIDSAIATVVIRGEPRLLKEVRGFEVSRTERKFCSNSFILDFEVRQFNSSFL